MKKYQRVLKYLYVLIADSRISLVNVSCPDTPSKKDGLILNFDVEFMQKHICHVEIDNDPEELLRALFIIAWHHPQRTASDYRFNVMLSTLQKPYTASIMGLVAYNRCISSRRIPFDIGSAIVASGSAKIFSSNREAYMSDFEYLDYFEVRLQDDSRDPYLTEDRTAVENYEVDDAHLF